MATNNAGVSDEVIHELNPTGPEPDYGPQADPIPERPADGATKAKWVDYCEALGANRAMLLGEVQHYDPGQEVTTTRRVPVGIHDDAEPEYFSELGEAIEASIEGGESAEDFAERMRALRESAQQRAEREAPEYREVTVTERGGYVQAKALTREQLIELADRLGG
jgi:hypothetical protein